MFWANDPSTDTPISADNLSRMEKYTLATAGSNGDFYVNFPNGANLATNDIVFIAFPTATNPASDARLSVNNGTTYKPIFNVLAQKALDIQNKRLMLVYDGTNFINIDMNAPTYIQLVGATGLQSLTTSWALFNKYNSTQETGATQGVMASSIANGTITCNFDGYVEVFASCEFTGCTAADTVGLKLVVNGSDIWYSYLAVANTGIHVLQIPKRIIQVTSGTVISVYGMNTTSSRGSMGRNANNAISGNIFTVKRV